jgi:protein ImuA
MTEGVLRGESDVVEGCMEVRGRPRFWMLAFEGALGDDMGSGLDLQGECIAGNGAVLAAAVDALAISGGSGPERLVHGSVRSERESLDRDGVMSRLSREIRSLETSGRPAGSWISSGSSAMDRCLPGGGYALGSMVELVHGMGGVTRVPGEGDRSRVRSGLPVRGLGVLAIALRLAREWIADGKYLVVVDREERLYVPGLVSLGIPCERLIVLRPRSESDAIWGMDQALRSPAVGGVIASVQHLDDRVARRLQLATEQGGGLGILLRDVVSARLHPSWSEVQWRVQAAERDRNWEMRWFDLELMRANGGQTGGRVRLGLSARGEWVEGSVAKGVQHEQTAAKHLAAQLAQPATRRRELAG